VVGASGFEPEASCAQGSCKKSILLARLALFYVMVHGFGPNSAVVGPKLDPSFGVNPLGGTNYLDTVSAFVKVFLHLLAGEGVWGRGRHLSPLPQQSCINLCAVLFVLKEHHRCASRFGRT
jgi:hypothetical protein